MRRLPVTIPSVTALEVAYVQDAIKNGWGANCYDYLRRFEVTFAEYVGTQHALATSSCTGALHMACHALSIGPGDEVIVPELTWVATVAPIVHLGATPVFVDVLPETWCIDAEKAAAAITARTKAILPVHLYGNVVEMDELLNLAARRGLFLIEDAAEGLGSEYRGKKVGTIGICGVFSFAGTKTVSTGEGGMFVTDDGDLYRKVAQLADHGRVADEARMYFPHSIGFKYKMSNVQAAMGCAQIERGAELIDHRRAVLAWYKEDFAGVDEISMNVEQSYATNSAWMPTAIFDESLGVDVVELIRYLKNMEIDARTFFYPLSSLPMFTARPENRVAYGLHARGVNLPSYFDLTREDVSRVADAVLEFLGRKGSARSS